MVMDPYQVLSLGPDADEAAVRQRYLALVRQYPPEREPQRFAEIRAAYDQLRDPITNLHGRLFSLASVDTLESLAAAEQSGRATRRIPTDLLLSLADN